MSTMSLRLLLIAAVLSAAVFSLLLSPLAHSQEGEVLAIDWVDLMSQKDLDAILDAPAMSHDGCWTAPR